jgi:thioredoxin reductase
VASIAIVGDGPAGLSAALFLAKNGHAATVYGQDDTAMHYALLRNYLGVDEEPGSSFQARARDQVARHGASFHDERVTRVRPDGDGFEVATDGSHGARADYVILATAKKGVELANQLGIGTDRDGVDVDSEYRSQVDRVYVVGRLARPNRSQAIISAGAGAVAALDIRARVAGKDVTDWDTPDDA